MIGGAKTRTVEWMLAALMFGWGAAVLYPGEMLGNATNRYLILLMPEDAWGVIAAAIGVFRMSFLYVNGAWRRSPIMRLIGCFLGTLWWTALFALYMRAINDGAQVYPSLVFYPTFILFEYFSCFRCAQDACAMGAFGRTPKENA